MTKHVSVFGAASMIDSILKWYPNFLKKYNQDAKIICPEAPLAAKDIGNIFHYIQIERKPKLFSDMLTLLKMIIFFYKEKIESVHSFMPKAGLITALTVVFFRVFRVKIFFIHTFTGLVWTGKTGYKRWLLSKIDAFILAVVDIAVVESQGVCSELSMLSAKNKIKINKIGCGNIAGVDCNHFKPRDVFFKKNTINLAFIGRVCLEKGIFDLIDVFKNNNLKSVNLKIIGSLELTVNQKKIFDMFLSDFSENVEYLGFQSDIRNCLMDVDFLIFPSWREGFPNVILQALAFGVPVISSNVYGVEEIVNIASGDVGYFFDAKDKNGMAQAILNAKNISTENYHIMSQRCVKTIQLHYSESVAIKGLLDFYKNIGIFDE